MKNFQKLGDTITLPAPYAVASGAGALVGTIFGVAQAAYAANQSGEFLRKGVVTMPKANGATTIGAKAYWDDAAKVVTATVGSNKLIGAFLTVQAAGDPSVSVLLMPTAA